MGNAIGEVLPLALGVAISPLPIVAVILMLLSPRARTNGPLFLTGWMVGLAIVSVAVTAISGSAGLGAGGGGSLVGSLLQILLGILLVGLAFREWRNRPRPGRQPPLPGWMRAIDSVTAVKALGLAVLLSAVNPKNLSLTVAAALTIAKEGMSTVGAAFEIFVVIASLSIAVPVVLYLAGGAASKSALDSLRVWLNANNATVMAVLMLVIGVVLVGKGLG